MVAWACREGTPEDEDEKSRRRSREGDGIWAADKGLEMDMNPLYGAGLGKRGSDREIP